MKSNITIAVVGEDNDVQDVLFKGFKEFPSFKVILLTKEKYLSKSEKISNNLAKFAIETEIIKISNEIFLEELFLKIREVSNKYKNDNLIISVDTDYYTSCLALSSAFVNGIAAIGILKDKLITYPIMKFSYENSINAKKFEILTVINKEENISSMESLAKKTKMSLPLIAYHLRGNKDSKGLIDMGLVNAEKENGTIKVTLTDLGRLIVRGSIDCDGCNN